MKRQTGQVFAFPIPGVFLFGAMLMACVERPATEVVARSSEVDWGREIPALMAQAGVPGMTMAVLEGGEVSWQGAFGIADVATGAPVVLDSVFEAASLSKPVFGYLAMRLVERGVIDLDRSVIEVFDEPRLHGEPRRHAITPRMLLAHRSGLPNWGGEALRLSHGPDSRWGYSGEGYMYLTRLAEVATGLDLDALARREVFTPLGMSHSSFVWKSEHERTAAIGHDMLGRRREPRRRTAPNAAGALQTTAGDFARFLRAVLRHEGLSEQAVALMLTSHGPVVRRRTGDPEPSVHWGLGWGLEQGEQGQRLFHWGSNRTYQCGFMLDPESGDGFVYFTNSENGLSLAAEIAHLALPGPFPSLEWQAFEPWNDARRQARQALQRAFLEDGPAAGLELYRQLGTTDPETVDAEQLRAVASYLEEAGDAVAARALLVGAGLMSADGSGP